MIVAKGSSKGCFFLVSEHQKDLVVSLESIKKAHERVFESGVYQLVYSRDGEGVFGTCLIKTSEVHTNSLLPILLFNYRSVSQPIRIKNFLYCPNLFQLVRFFFYCNWNAYRRISGVVFLWLSFRIHVQLMAYEDRKSVV